MDSKSIVQRGLPHDEWPSLAPFLVDPSHRVLARHGKGCVLHDEGEVPPVTGRESVPSTVIRVSRVLISGTRRLSYTLKRHLRRRAAVEPKIGHMKNDGLLGRNFLKGMVGDAMNALLCGAGHNLRKILARARFGLYRFLIAGLETILQISPGWLQGLQAA